MSLYYCLLFRKALFSLLPFGPDCKQPVCDPPPLRWMEGARLKGTRQRRRRARENAFSACGVRRTNGPDTLPSLLRCEGFIIASSVQVILLMAPTAAAAAKMNTLPPQGEGGSQIPRVECNTYMGSVLIIGLSYTAYTYPTQPTLDVCCKIS